MQKQQVDKITADEVSDCVLRYVGTHFIPCGTVPGIGLDCLGILKCLIDDLHLPINYRHRDIPTAYAQRDFNGAKRVFDKLLIKAELPKAGMVLLFLLGRLVHIGVLTPYGLVDPGAELITLSPFDERLEKRMKCTYKLPGVTY